MQTLRDYLNQLMIEYAIALLQGKDVDQERMRLLEEYLVKIKKYVIGE